MTVANRPSLDDIRKLPLGEIAALPADQLALLLEDAEAAFLTAKNLKEWLEGAIALRYRDRAASARSAENKDTGTVRFDDGPVTVVADLPKRVRMGPATAWGPGRAHSRRRRGPVRLRRAHLQGARAEILRLARAYSICVRVGAHRKNRQANFRAATAARGRLRTTAGRPAPQGRAGIPSAPGQRPAVSQSRPGSKPPMFGRS